MIPLLLFASCSTTEAPSETIVSEPQPMVSDEWKEMIKNGDVSQGSEGWGLYVHPPAEGKLTVNDEKIEYIISKTGVDNWNIQGNYAGLTFIEGASYKLSVDMYSSMEREGQIRIQLDSDPYTAYLEENILLSTEPQTYAFEFVMNEKSDEFAKLCFNLGRYEGISDETHSIYLDNLSILVDTSTLETATQSKDEAKIAVNQIGYRRNGIKEVRISEAAENFYVVDSTSQEVLYTGTFSEPIDDAPSGEMVYVGDFSDFTEKGSFQIEVDNLGQTESFEIRDDVYSELKDSVLKMLYLQRCGFDLTENEAGAWAHDACHLEMATIYGTDKKIEVSGGWHDAGDYGRYVGPGAKTIADLLLSGDLNSAVLNEIRYELDWMLKMQDKETGGVYHKVTTANFIGSIMPDKSNEPLIVSPISSTATGQFSAIMAMSSRYFKATDKVYAESLLEAAKKAWQWLDLNKSYPGFVNPEGINTGEYGDSQDGDERYWAAIELFLTTGNEDFHSFAKASYKEHQWNGTSWINVGDYGNLSYILSENGFTDPDFHSLLVDDFLVSASELSTITDNDGYGVSLETYDWGSNGTVADNGLKLVIAYDLTGDKQYLDNAERHLHYLLGSNSLGYCYTTGFGHKRVLNSHHRPSNAAGEIMPGMLAGGPNQNLQDPLAKSKLSEMPPQKCYIDAEPSYSTNEITIYWNSPFFALLTAFE